jgi:hypothetical protein
MNLINHIDHLSLKDKIYCFLLSELVKEDGKLICEHDAIDIEDYFGEGSQEALKELGESGLVRVADDCIIIGSYVGRTYKLFIANEASPEVEYEAIIKRAEEFAELSGLGNVVKFELETLISKDNLTVQEFVKFFRACYEAEYQTQHRDFYGKEAGQIKNLMRVYSEVALKRIIIYYLSLIHI